MLSPQEEKLYQEAQAIREMAETPGWDQWLRPWLEAKRDQSFPDPSAFKSDEEFTYAARTASTFKKVIAELLMYVEGQKNAFDQLTKKKKQDHDPFGIGK